jgi:anti-anti-sigma regulatory factor
MSRSHGAFVAAADVATATVQARGALRRTSASSLLGTVDVLLETGHRYLTVDLTHVPEVDDAGARLLAVLQHDLWAHGGRLRIVNATSQVHERLVAAHVTSSAPLPGAVTRSRGDGDLAIAREAVRRR